MSYVSEGKKLAGRRGNARQDKTGLGEKCGPVWS